MKQVSKMQYKPEQSSKPHQELVITDAAKDAVDKLFTALEAMFPAWRVSLKDKDAIKNTKLVWTKALVRNKQETGQHLNIERGLVHAEKSTNDFFPSVGKFIQWCNQDDALIEQAKQALANFNNGEGVIDAVEKETRARCGYEARRLNQEKRDKLFLKTFMDVIENRPELLDIKLIEENKSKTIFTRRENQAEINKAGISNLKKLFGE